MFDEFANWAIKQSLDLDDDDDVSDGEMQEQQLAHTMNKKYLSDHKKKLKEQVAKRR